jgi:hypothetical protein
MVQKVLPYSLMYRTNNYKTLNGAPVEGGSVDFQSYRSWNNFRAGIDNPSWKRQIRSGNNATTPFAASAYDYYDIPVAGTIIWKNRNFFPPPVVTYYVRQAEFGISPETVAAYNVSSVDLQARQSFVSKYRSKRTQFQTGVFAGEIREAVHMIKNPAQALRSALSGYHRDLKKRLGRKHKLDNRVVQETWLEYVFGWRPLINDVQDACKLATAHPFAAQEPITAQAKVEWKTTKTSLTTGTTVLGGPYWTRYFWCENEMSIRYKGAARAENNPPGFPEQLGLSWSNVLPTIWELIPYSFLVDYFTNVGKVIDGLSTGYISLAWSCKTDRRESKAMCFTENAVAQNNSLFGAGNWTGVISGSGVTGHQKSVSRDSPGGVSVGITDVSFRVPGTGTKWLNIAALASLRK